MSIIVMIFHQYDVMMLFITMLFYNILFLVTYIAIFLRLLFSPRVSGDVR